MKKALRRLLIISGTLIFVLTLILVILAYFFEDKVGEKILSLTNEQLKTELRVDHFELSVLSTFPNIGANLIGVELEGTDGELLLETKSISFRIGLLSVLSSSVKVKSVVIADGELNIHVDKKGNTNYDVLLSEETEEEEDQPEDAGVGIALSKAQLENIDVNYEDASTRSYVSTKIESAEFSGHFSSAQFLLESEATAQIGQIELDDESFLRGKTFSYDAHIEVDSEKGVYNFNKVDLRLGDLPLSVSGVIEEKDGSSEMDLMFTSNDGNLAAIIDLLPEEYRGLISEIDTRGDFEFLTTIQGKYSDREMPAIESELRFSDGRISADKMKGSIKDVAFLATFTNGAQRRNSSVVMEVQNLTGYYQGETFTVNLKVNDLDDPNIDFSVDGKIGFAALVGLSPVEDLTGGTGNMEFQKVSLRGSYDDMLRSYRMGRVNFGGQVLLNDAGFKWRSEDIEFPQGKLSFADNDVAIENLQLRAPGTSMIFSGSAKNLLPVLFADSLNSQKAVLEFDARLDAEELDIDQLMVLQAPSEEVVEDVADRGQTDSLTQVGVEKRALSVGFLKGEFIANIENYNAGNITGSDFSGTLNIENNKLTIKGETKAMNGHFELDAEMDIEEMPSMEAKLSCDGIDIHEFFRQSDNFGQDVLVADNLSGKMDAKILIRLYFDQLGELLYDKMRVWAAIGLQDGELKDFEMLEDFSSVVNIRDLRSINFSNVENFLEVRDQRIFIPAMFIQSNALNLTISGEHSFDQNIAYYLKVNAGQVLADKFRQHDPNLRPKPARRNGFFNLHYSILGSAEKFTVNADKKRVKLDFEQSELRKRSIRDELERAFNTVIELVDEPIDWRDIPEYNQDIDEDNPVFLDEVEGGGGGL